VTMAEPGSGAALVVIDMQRLFGDPSSPWVTPGYASIVDGVDRLARAFGPERTTFTRFLIPERWDGSWVPYYREWETVTRPEAAPLQELTEPWASRRPQTLDRTTFSKWGDELRAAAGPSRALVLCGVATDCCVIATALPAADAGMFVRVVGDACAGATRAQHEGALTVMRGFAPQIEVTTVDDELARLATSANATTDR
jgi:nicotinamidase-related amidase